MNDLTPGSPESWKIYTTTSSESGTADRDGLWRSSLGTNMNAISFGFVATAILIAMFLVMAIFEHLFKPDPSFDSPQQISSGSIRTNKLAEEATAVQRESAVNYPVVMPGQQLPTYIAQPAPLPCPREAIFLP